MKALSLRQPWPWFILKGGKNLENRGWASSYRGPVLIHSSKWWQIDEIKDDLQFATHIARRNGTLPDDAGPSLTTLKDELGHIVGMATIIGVVLESPSEWFFGPKAFVLEDPVAFPDPVTCRGERGLFDVSLEVASACQMQIDIVRNRMAGPDVSEASRQEARILDGRRKAVRRARNARIFVIPPELDGYEDEGVRKGKRDEP